MQLIPAYGRDYKSKTEAEKDFYSGKDWIIADIMSPWDGAYLSCRDILDGEEVTLRYSKLRKVTVFKFNKNRVK